MSSSPPTQNELAPREPPKPAGPARAWHGGMRVCAACGRLFSRDQSRCPHCQQDHSPEALTRLANFSGNWFIHDADHPVPGVSLEFLIRQVRRGYLKADAVVRGPATKQQWKFAGEIAGLSHYVGQCWFCGGQVEPTDRTCPSCHVSFEAETPPASSATPGQPPESAVPVAAVTALPPSVAPASAPREMPAEMPFSPDGEFGDFASSAAIIPAANRPAPVRVRSDTNAINPVLLVLTLISVPLAAFFGLRLSSTGVSPVIPFLNSSTGVSPVISSSSSTGVPPGFVRVIGSPRAFPSPNRSSGVASIIPSGDVSFFGLTPDGLDTSKSPFSMARTTPLTRPTPLETIEPGELTLAPASAPAATEPGPASEVQRLWQEAAALENKGTLDALRAASDKLYEILRQADPADWPDELTQRIKQIKAKIKKKQDEQSKFFGL